MSSNQLVRLESFLFTRVKYWNEPRSLYWLLATIFCGVLYPCLGLAKIQGIEYVVQDDARQHIFWMARFIDPELFPDDLIADYFQNISPIGFSSLFKLLSIFSLDPIQASIFIPILLSILVSFGAFLFSFELLAIPSASFISTTIFNQNLWTQDGLTSSTARAFLIPIFVFFLWGVVRKSFFFSYLPLILLGFFYPSYVLVASGILVLQCFAIKDKKIRINQNKSDLLLSIIGLIIAFFLLLPHALDASEFGPIVTYLEAKELPAFQENGRTEFFQADFWTYIFDGSRSGIRISSILMPQITYIFFLFPIITRFKKTFSLVQDIKNIYIINQLFITGSALFIFAHIILFKLYLPSRYTLHSFRLSVSLLSGIVVFVLLQKFFELLKFISLQKSQKLIAIPIVILVAFIILVEPIIDKDFPYTGYSIGKHSSLYEFLQDTPKETLNLSLLRENDSLPSFTKRSIYAGREYGIPYHTGYYSRFRKRTKEMIAAHFTTKLNELQFFIRQSSVDYWIVNNQVFTAAFLENNNWLNQFQPETNQAIATLKSSTQPIALQELQEECTVFTDKDLSLIDSHCILQAELKD
ncbi:hypothetical protein Lepto7376_4371 [[Leptolyngbya] sp. PCC 7376]|uniref:hypothetical protein n=1 Tax=[Leptolyngbya] sp. PCC 7376 TaxID=111781 RepID=UPI00029F2FBB|nr:hypothetical protein [[Leptolyngbya] sp. PCC 7376]AFY40479.1 hypothetical protein Lepto7376_4371 [[Leptolyngbya] sp. PCC 7376]